MVDMELDDAEPIAKRSENLAGRKKIRDKLLDLYKDVEKGFDDQAPRTQDIENYWDIYNCRLGPKQFYQGNAEIFVPIVYEAIEARKTRFTNQIFPISGRHVECASSDATIPEATMALAEHYIRKSRLRSMIPALLLNGDIEGQYTIYCYWNKSKRHVVHRIKKPLELEDGPLESEDVEDIEEETIETAHPDIEIIADGDFLVLPATADSLQEALDSGGSITILRRWGKAKLRQLIDEGMIDKRAGEALIEEMSKDNTSLRPDKEKKMVSAAGIKGEGRGKYALVYETWSMVKTPEGHRLCQTYFGGPDKVLGCMRNPNWSDRIPIISEPVKKVQGSFKGIPPVASVADLQYFANDMINEAADSASFSMLPIIMTDPEKNPRLGSMVLSLAAVWQTSPNDTQFAKFPDIWRSGLDIVAGVKQEVFQALSVNASMISHGSPKKKLSQAEVAQETQVDLLTTADAVTIIENGVLTPLINFFIELDHQYREDSILVRSYGDLGIKAVMQSIDPIQMDNRYEFRWFGVEAARNAQQVQQQIAGMNVLRSLPPQLYPGYKLDLAPAISQMVENIFGPRLAALTFVDMRSQLGHDPKLEVELATQGVELPVSPMDNHQVAMQLLVKALQETGDPSGIIRVQLMKHQQIMMMQAQAQQQAMMGPQGGAGQPRIGAQPGQAMGGQQPPGAIHRDQMRDASVMPRKM